MASSLFASPIPCLLFRSSTTGNFKPSSLALLSRRSSVRAPHSSGAQQDGSSLAAAISDTIDSQLPIEDEDDIPTGGCRACGKAEIERGCNGEGRIQGGIAAVPGFGWWPIKAFRPCPALVASGGRYKRRGQSFDGIAFGKENNGASRATSEEADGRCGFLDNGICDLGILGPIIGKWRLDNLSHEPSNQSIKRKIVNP